MRPSDYPPPFDSNEFVAAPGEAEIEVGVLIVGAGPAGLACAIRLGQLLEGAPELAERLGDVPVAVLEKGKQPGSHLLSGAVVNPRSLRRLFDGRYRTDELPFYGRVDHESVYFLTPQRSLRIPTPPTMKNGGNYVASLAQLGRWLAERAEEGGATILPETSATKLLVTDGRQLNAIEQRDLRRSVQPQSVAQMIRVLNDTRRNNRIYIRLLNGKPGAVVNGEALTALPPSVLSVLESDSNGGSFLPIRSAAVGEWELPMDSAVTGSRVLAVEVDPGGSRQ